MKVEMGTSEEAETVLRQALPEANKLLRSIYAAIHDYIENQPLPDGGGATQIYALLLISPFLADRINAIVTHNGGDRRLIAYWKTVANTVFAQQRRLENMSPTGDLLQ